LPDSSFTNRRFRQSQNVAFAKAGEHRESNRHPQLIWNSLKDNAALCSCPRAISAGRLSVSPHAFDTLDGVFTDNAVLPAVLTSDRDYGHNVICLSAAMLLGHSITQTRDELRGQFGKRHVMNGHEQIHHPRVPGAR
jgi:hypothetical protein